MFFKLLQLRDIFIHQWSFYCRHDQCRSFASSRAWLPDAMPTGLPSTTLWHHVGVLEQRFLKTANFWNSSMATRRFLHTFRLGIQGSIGLLTTTEFLFIDVIRLWEGAFVDYQLFFDKVSCLLTKSAVFWQDQLVADKKVFSYSSCLFTFSP